MALSSKLFTLRVAVMVLELSKYRLVLLFVPESMFTLFFSVKNRSYRNELLCQLLKNQCMDVVYIKVQYLFDIFFGYD